MVTYDILFRQVLPGRTVEETLEEINSAYDPDAASQPMNLTGDQRAVWNKIVQRISREIGPVTTEEYLYSLTLCRDGPAGRLQLDYEGDSASIYIPYRYPRQAALTIMAEAYHIAWIIEEESSLEGYDAEVEQSIRTGDIDIAAAKLGAVSRWAQDHLT